MRPSHPPTLLTRVKRTWADAAASGALPRGSSVLIAVSGGPDSMALLHAMARLAPSFDVVVAAHGIDHGLRTEGAEELDAAEDFARELAVPFSRTKVDLAKGANVQARARDARRAALIAAADAFAGPEARIATAHHADDRAETVLLRLLRGSSLRSLAPLPFHDGRWVRPLIHVTSAAVTAHVSRHAIPFATDPSNADPRYLRARVRHELLPLLRTLDPAVAAHLNTLADEIAALDAPTPPSAVEPDRAAPSDRKKVSGNEFFDEFAIFRDLPPATTLRTKRALRDAIRNRAHDSRLFLPEGLVAIYDRQHLAWVVRRRVPPDASSDAPG